MSDLATLRVAFMDTYKNEHAWTYVKALEAEAKQLKRRLAEIRVVVYGMMERNTAKSGADREDIEAISDIASGTPEGETP